MHQYKIYVLNWENHIQKRHDLEARDDVSALEKAKTLALIDTVEIWESARLIARVGKNGEAVP